MPAGLSTAVSVLRRPAVSALLALLAYVLIAFLVTLHAWADPTHTWPGNQGDPYKFMDFLGWTPHALSTGHNPLFMSVIDHPRGVNLAWETAMPLAGILLWPITATFGVVAAFNVWDLLALTLDGWCTYLWLRGHTRGALAAFLGGVLVVLGPYTYAHALGHLNLISFFPIPLLFICLERAFTATRFSWRLALGIGALSAVQIYLAEELFALFVIGAAVALVIAAVVHRRIALPALRRALPTVALSVGVLALLALPLLAYQFLGPRAVHGVIQPHDVYVTDLANIVLPSTLTWVQPVVVSPARLAELSVQWREPTAYVGLFLLALSVYAAVRWWRRPFVRIVALATAVVELLSLGPHLHVASTLVHAVRLPALVLQHLPLVDNLLPVRLSLIATFGFAFLFAVALDNTLLRNPLRAAGGSVLCVLAFVTIVPTGPLPATGAVIPPYFTAADGARSLPLRTVALVGPYTDNGTTDAIPMLWQAAADYHFALVDALAITVDEQGTVVFLQRNNALYRAFHSIQMDGVQPPHSAAQRSMLLSALHRRGVTTIILGPMPHRAEALDLVTWLIGRPPEEREGVALWQLPA